MSHSEIIKEAQRLSLPERLELIDELIESVEAESTLSPPQQAELEKRYDAYMAKPDEGEPWELVRERIRGSLDAAGNHRSA